MDCVPEVQRCQYNPDRDHVTEFVTEILIRKTTWCSHTRINSSHESVDVPETDDRNHDMHNHILHPLGSIKV